MHSGPPINLAIVVQSGRLATEALIFAASLAGTAQSRPIRLWFLEPSPGPLWPVSPSVQDPRLRTALTGFGEIVPFASRHFGAAYPQGNKIEGLFALPADTPFVFFDTDTIVLGDLGAVPFDFDRPSASLRREATWPKPRPGGPTRRDIWSSLYAQAGLDLAKAEDPRFPETDWRRFPYYNAGAFYYRCPRIFARTYLQTALAIRDAPPAALSGQKLSPWLDQVALPVVIHALGGGPDALPAGYIDGATTCHWRRLPLLYARENDAAVAAFEAACARPEISDLLSRDPLVRRYVLDGAGQRLRAAVDRTALPPDEATLRKTIRALGLWDE